MGLVSGLSVAKCSDSESFLVAHALFSQDGCQQEGFWEVVGYMMSPFDPSWTLLEPIVWSLTRSDHSRRARHLGMWSQWALRSITTNKASGSDGIPVELFQILKDDAEKVLHSICQQIWKTQQWPQDWKRSVFILILKKGNGKECSDYLKLHSSHTLAK